MLVIEVDGGYHSERTQQEDDAVRQEWLESVGYKVIRFSNEALLVDIKSTIYTIINYLGFAELLSCQVQGAVDNPHRSDAPSQQKAYFG